MLYGDINERNVSDRFCSYMTIFLLKKVSTFTFVLHD